MALICRGAGAGEKDVQAVPFQLRAPLRCRTEGSTLMLIDGAGDR